MPLIDTLLVDNGPGQTRLATLSAGEVVEIYYHDSNTVSVGEIYYGRIKKVLSKNRSVFVDLGKGSLAFFSYPDKAPNEGEMIQVRVVQPAREGKGPKVSLVREQNGSIKNKPSSPKLLKKTEHPLSWCCRNYYLSLKEIIITPPANSKEISLIVDNHIHCKPQITHDDIFLEFGVDEEIDNIVDPVVYFDGGGSIIIQQTSAFVAVDIDSGSMAVHDANKSAIKCLARQMRLRALSGPIIIDLIPSRQNDSLITLLKESVSDDPVPITIYGLTPGGRLELNRRRSRLSLHDVLLDNITGGNFSARTIAFQSLRMCIRYAFKNGSSKLTISANDKVIEILKGPLRYALNEAEGIVKNNILLDSSAERNISEIVISG